MGAGLCQTWRNDGAFAELEEPRRRAPPDPWELEGEPGGAQMPGEEETDGLEEFLRRAMGYSETDLICGADGPGGGVGAPPDAELCWPQEPRPGRALGQEQPDRRRRGLASQLLRDLGQPMPR